MTCQSRTRSGAREARGAEGTDSPYGRAGICNKESAREGRNKDCIMIKIEIEFIHKLERIRGSMGI